MYEAAFSHAALPKPAHVLKLPLRPFSVAHRLYLLRQDNPLADADRFAEFHHLAGAVLICCQSWRELQAGERDLLLPLKMKILLWRNRRCDRDFELRQFREYYAAGTTAPPVKAAPANSAPSRRPGAPVELRLLQFLMHTHGLTEEQALDYPLGLAQWHWCAYWESQDSLRIKSTDDLSFEIFTQAMDEGKTAAQAREIARLTCPA